MKLPKGFPIIGTELYPYQITSAVFGMKRDNIGLLLDLGLGKTLVSITIARYRLQKSNARKVLVVSPTSILQKWKKEIERFSEYPALVIRTSNRDERLYRALNEDFPFHIINHDSLFPLLRDVGALREDLTKRGKRGVFENEIDNIKLLKYDVIIFDESSKFLKNFKTNRTLAAILLARFAKYKMILTGTLIGNKPFDIWPQFKILDGGKAFMNNPYSFRARFFKKQTVGRFTKYVLDPTFISYFNKKIYEICIKFNKEEVLEFLPDKIYDEVPIELEGDFKEAYISLQKETYAEIETELGATTVNIINILSKLTKLRQATSGFVKNTDGKEAALLHRPKFDWLLEEIDSIIEYEESVIIWCIYRFTIAMIQSELDKRHIQYITLTGDDKDKDAKWSKFQQTSIPVFIGQIQTGDVGIDLFKINDVDITKKQNMILYDRVWTVDSAYQTRGRIDRIGQKQVCRFVEPYIENTIDVKMMNAVKENKSVADMIMKQEFLDFMQSE